LDVVSKKGGKTLQRLLEKRRGGRVRGRELVERLRMKKTSERKL